MDVAPSTKAAPSALQRGLETALGSPLAGHENLRFGRFPCSLKRGPSYRTGADRSGHRRATRVAHSWHSGTGPEWGNLGTAVFPEEKWYARRDSNP